MTITAISKIQPADGRAINVRYPAWTHIVPLPPDSLMWSVGGASVEMFVVLGDAWAQLVSRYTSPQCAVLDIGCGCGRTARVLLNNRYIETYIGFDVIRENVEWCQTFIQPAWHGTARFHHFDLYSREYNPTATLHASSLVFPCGDAAIDVCFASSVFTHLLEPDAAHYLREIARVLTANGRAILSIHNAVPAGERFYGTETRIDIATDYFVEMARAAGLEEIERIDDLGGQQVLIFQPASTAAGARPPATSVAKTVRVGLDQPAGSGPFSFLAGQQVAISGWAFLNPPDTEAPDTHLEIVSLRTGAMTRIAPKRGDRPDVAAHFADDRLLTSGFSAAFTIDSGFRGDHTVRLVLSAGEHRHGTDLFSFTVPPDPSERTLRRELAARFLRGAGIEIGALQRRLEVPEHCSVTYVDRMPLEDLLAHYPELAGQALQKPDLLDDGETLTKIPAASQDFVIANHFLEHCENPIQTLFNFSRVLKSGGVLYIAVPDKRFTFDIARPTTDPAVLMRTYASGAREDRDALYEEWARYVMHLPEAEVGPAAARLRRERYSIHFSVWTLTDLLGLLSECRQRLNLPFALEWVVSSDNEVILILRRTPDDGAAAVPAPERA